MPYPRWHGTIDESRQLQQAVSRHCACMAVRGQAAARCAAHEMLTDDQRALDGLLFARHIVRRLVREELRSEQAA